MDTARRKIENAQRNKTASYDKNVKQTPYFLPDDEVMLYNNRQVKGHVRSFEPKYIGPFIAVKQIYDLSFLLRDAKTNKEQVVHINRMVRYLGRRNFHENQIEDDASYKRNRAIMQRIISNNQKANRNVARETANNNFASENAVM